MPRSVRRVCLPWACALAIRGVDGLRSLRFQRRAGRVLGLHAWPALALALASALQNVIDRIAVCIGRDQLLPGIPEIGQSLRTLSVWVVTRYDSFRFV